ncbi:MAG: ribonuclease D, partial [Alphaproteobacteria bacterium]
ADKEGAVAIDTRAPDLDLSPFYKLMADENIVKVFHAARQDFEIFYLDKGGVIPHPLFDTQIAAMVCGYGEQAGYETLVNSICGKSIDKSQRFTDWSKRPLSDKQLNYALSDVTYLRQVYETLKKKIEGADRLSWVNEEMGVLTSPSTYENHPENAWKRLKVKSTNQRFLAQVQALAGLRETEAQRLDVPRNRVMDDKSLLQLAAHAPHNEKELRATAGHAWFLKDKKLCAKVLQLVARTESMPKEKLPPKPPQPSNRKPPEGTMELLKVLLKHQCQEAGVATKLVATVAELEAYAKGDNGNAHFLMGWRKKVFGQYAEQWMKGNLAISVSKKGLDLKQISK